MSTRAWTYSRGAVSHFFNNACVVVMIRAQVEDPHAAPVWEITGAEFSESTSHTADGISIRFPRVTRIRDDKGTDGATSLRELKALVKASKATVRVVSCPLELAASCSYTHIPSARRRVAGEFSCRGTRRRCQCRCRWNHAVGVCEGRFAGAWQAALVACVAVAALTVPTGIAVSA